MSDPMFERVLVTGGTGFMGRYVVSSLVSSGYRPLVTTLNADRADLDEQDIDLVDLDLTDIKGTIDLIDSYRPQALIHLAGATGHDDPTGQRCYDLNYTATVAMLEHLSTTNVERVVMLGSAAEYGDQPVPFSEEMPASPISPYGVSKAKATKAAMTLFAETNFPVTVLRVFSVFGHGQPSHMFLSQLIRHALAGTNFKMSDGEQKRDYVFAGDVATAVLSSLITNRSIGRMINIGSGVGVPLKEIAHAVWQICDADPTRLEMGALDKNGDDGIDTEADITLAEELLDWRPSASILPAVDRNYLLPELVSEMRQDLAKAAE